MYVVHSMAHASIKQPLIKEWFQNRQPLDVSTLDTPCKLGLVQHSRSVNVFVPLRANSLALNTLMCIMVLVLIGVD